MKGKAPVQKTYTAFQEKACFLFRMRLLHGTHSPLQMKKMLFQQKKAA